jgi:predicted NBD/HSP70 family sugar kinase
MANPRAIRQFNESRALSAIFRQGPLSRADLARRLKLTRSTVGGIVQSLTDSGLLRERPDASGPRVRVGRPGVATEINGDGAYFIGADIGVDRVSAVAVDLACRVRAEASRDFQGMNHAASDAADVAAALFRRVVEALPDPTKVRGLAISVPGFPVRDGTSYNATILGWKGEPIGDLMRARLGSLAPVVNIENNANAFAVAASYLRDDLADTDTLAVLLDGGVGAGIISGGRLFRGQLGLAGEIGHLRIGEEGFVFDPERPGGMETFVGENALLARHRYHGGPGETLAEFLSALGNADPAALRTVSDWGRWLGRGLAGVVSVLGSPRIILGGSLGAVYPFAAEVVEGTIAASLSEGYAVPSIELRGGRCDRPVVGAAFLLHQAMLAPEVNLGV